MLRQEENREHFYKITKKISAKYSSGSSVVRDKDGKILTKEKDIQERWEEHFKEVLNREPPARPVRIEKGRESENIRSEEISEEEIRSALRKVKNNKAPGIDNISGELMKADAETSTKWLLGNILIERIRKGIDEALMKEQAGFRRVEEKLTKYSYLGIL